MLSTPNLNCIYIDYIKSIFSYSDLIIGHRKAKKKKLKVSN